MFLCDFHKKHFLRVWKVGNLATIDDQIRLVDYLWFYNAKDEEGTGKILKRKTILSLQLFVMIKDFYADGYLNNISDPLPGLTIQRKFGEPDQCQLFYFLINIKNDPSPFELFRKFLWFGAAICPSYQIIISVLQSRIIFLPETEDRGLRRLTVVPQTLGN